MSLIKVTLGGVPLQMDVGQEHGWVLQYGSSPYAQEFLVSKARGESIMTRAVRQYETIRGTYVPGRPQEKGPITFEIDGGDGKPPVKVQGLYATQCLPGVDINTLRVLVVDRRFLWTRTFLDRSYNIRRNTGEQRLLSGELTPAEVSQRVGDRVYRRNSLKDFITPWTAEDILKDVLEALCGPNGFKVDVPVTLSRPPEGLVLRDTGPQALDKVLAFLPGLQVYAHPDGLIHVANALDLTEEAMAEKAAKRIYWAGNLKKVDLSLVRPQRVKVGFEREHEVRYDYKTAGAQTGTTGRTKIGREEPVVDNVIPVVDEFLNVNGKKYYYGTWIKFEDWLIGVNADTDTPRIGPPLTEDLILRWYLNGFSWIRTMYLLYNGGAADAVWNRRLDALQNHWRTTFRVVSAWVDKTRSIKAIRAAIMDPETGTRARADAYVDYTVRPSNKALYERGGGALGVKVDGYAADLKNARVSPFEVTVLDADQQIFQVRPRIDLHGMGTTVAPGHFKGAPVTISGTAAGARLLWNQVPLDPAWELAVVMTVVPDSPRTEQRLWWEEVTPTEAADVLPGTTSVGKCSGPDWATFTGVDTARFAWIDGNANDIKKAIWDGTASRETMLKLIVNRGGTAGQVGTLEALARAQAARIYSTLLDRVQGRITVGMNSEVMPTGNLRTVRHRVRREGPGRWACYTDLDMPTVQDEPGIYSLLPDSVQRILLKLVQS